MAKDAIIFACANPVPEVWPWEAEKAGARIIATGRSDFPNQVNNSLGFPAIFRGVLDVRAKMITDEMCITVAEELARCAEERAFENYILHIDGGTFSREATAAGMKTIEQTSRKASRTIDGSRFATLGKAQEETHALIEAGLIPLPK
jgi:malate dehydrogenase (oxaloacetate-decarboxylating)